MLHLSKHRSSLMLLLPLTTQPLHSFLFLALISRRRINQSNNVHVPVCLGQHARGLAYIPMRVSESARERQREICPRSVPLINAFDVSNLSPSTNPPDSTPELARSTPELAPRHDPFRRPDNTPQPSPRRDPPLPPKNTPIPSPQLSPRSTENMRQQIFSQGYTQNPFFVQM